jgi:hypothetical protein
MPRKKNPPPAPVVAFTMATRTARYGNTQPNTQPSTQSNTQSNTPDPTLDPALDPTLDPTPDPTSEPTPEPDESQRQTIPTKKRASLIWTDMMEETLFNELYRQDRLGKRADIGFKSEAWAVVRDTVQDAYTGCIVIDVSQLKNKESNYKALYKDWRWLREQSGFGRDPDTGRITASIQAWNDVIKVYFYYFNIYIYT